MNKDEHISYWLKTAREDYDKWTIGLKVADIPLLYFWASLPEESM